MLRKDEILPVWHTGGTFYQFVLKKENIIFLRSLIFRSVYVNKQCLLEFLQTKAPFVNGLVAHTWLLFSVFHFPMKQFVRNRRGSEQPVLRVSQAVSTKNSDCTSWQHQVWLLIKTIIRNKISNSMLVGPFCCFWAKGEAFRKSNYKIIQTALNEVLGFLVF